MVQEIIARAKSGLVVEKSQPFKIVARTFTQVTIVGRVSVACTSVPRPPTRQAQGCLDLCRRTPRIAHDSPQICRILRPVCFWFSI